MDHGTNIENVGMFTDKDESPFTANVQMDK